MSQRFTDQVAIVTGGSRGIGLAICQALAREGATVIIASFHEGRGQAAVEAIAEEGGRAEFIATNVAQRDQAARLVEITLERFGDIHVLVNNAGQHINAPFWKESEAIWELMYQVNILGTVWPSQMVVPHMMERGGGAIVHVASKAVELAPYAIRVNAVCPGPVMTDMLLEAVPSEAGRQKLAKAAPLGRIGQPEDIAAAVAYLASSESDLCTGQAVSLDGGLSILK